MSAGTGGNAAATGGSGGAGQGGSSNSGTGGMGGAGVGGAAGSSGSGTGGSAATDSGAAGADSGGGTTDPPPPRPINITPGGGCNCNIGSGGGTLSVDTNKPIQGKLVVVLGGICGGPGGGGIEGYAKAAGFHIWMPPTQTCVNSAPQKYKDIIAMTPLDPEANRQVGDARMELFDGVDRVDWVTVNKGESIVERTQVALKDGMTKDPGGDWGFFLNTDGTVRWTDVYVVGYSWGSQTWAMISSYVRFGRVFTTSGPQAEGFPNATWITHPAATATPNDRKYMAVGFINPYPSTNTVDTAPNTVTSMIDTTLKAGWVGPPMNVKPGDKGPFTGAHLFAMVGSDPHSPGGHTIFCTNDPLNGWAALCTYAFGIK
jgi:hypothetical protein